MTKPIAPTRLSSTILLVRERRGELEVFMLVRHHQIDFASGAFVFPGGALEPGDRAIADAAELCAPLADAEQRALRVAAVRETFEECGILLARPRGESALASAARVKSFADRQKGLGFGAALAAEGLELAIDLLIPFAHWITPTALPKRFDTHFFIAAAPDGQTAVHDGEESVDSAWINPLRAVQEGEAGRYTIILPTRLNLEMLARQNTVIGALEAARTRKIVTVEPVARQKDGGWELTIPLEADYGGDVFML